MYLGRAVATLPPPATSHGRSPHRSGVALHLVWESMDDVFRGLRPRLPVALTTELRQLPGVRWSKLRKGQRLRLSDLQALLCALALASAAWRSGVILKGWRAYASGCDSISAMVSGNKPLGRRGHKRAATLCTRSLPATARGRPPRRRTADKPPNTIRTASLHSERCATKCVIPALRMSRWSWCVN